MGRLRQKLADYYQAEGKDDIAIVDQPRGHFRLTCEPRLAGIPTVTETAIVPAVPAAPVNPWRIATVVLAAALSGVFLLSLAVFSFRAAHPETPVRASLWSADLEELWQPFFSPRPLVLVVGNPLFLQFDNKALYRDLSIEKWDDLLKSPRLSAVNKALGSRESRPVYYYAAVGDVSAVFLLGQRLGPRQPNMSVVRSSQLGWQQMADANVLFLGPPRFFRDRSGSLPVTLEITEVPEGFRNLHPLPGEPELFKYRTPEGFFEEDGEACVLITRMPGPEGNSDVETFAANSTFGRLGAVKAFTDPAFVRTLTQKMRAGSGHLPRYFQVMLKVRYKGGVPTETSYLLHRELRRH